MQQFTKPHAAILASPGMGHLIPVLELAKIMSTRHGFHITVFIVPSEHTTISSQLLTNYHHENLDLVHLPPVNISPIVGEDASLTIKLVVTMRESLIPLRREISAMKFRPIMLIVDIFGTEAFSVADEFDLLQYVFITSNAFFLAVTVYSGAATKEVIDGHVNEHKPLEIPGCGSVRYEDTMEQFLDPTPNSPFLQGYLELGNLFSKAHGILVNSWEGLETTTFAGLRDEKLLGRIVEEVYPIGPLVRNIEPNGSKSDYPVMDWLDQQSSESVLYVSFGSGGTLSAKQILELAWGLELSGNRFIWVLRPPSDKDASKSFFSVGQDLEVDNLEYLPDGFLTRTRDIGLVVPTWAPQMEILSHPSVGGFLSHCGWNSALESMMNGVPMISWPLYAEQKMNAATLTNEIKVAIRPELPPAKDGVVGREEIAKTVREIMVEEKGREMRKIAKALKCSGENALNEGGSSYNSMTQLAKECSDILREKSRGA